MRLYVAASVPAGEDRRTGTGRESIPPGKISVRTADFEENCRAWATVLPTVQNLLEETYCFQADAGFVRHLIWFSGREDLNQQLA